MHEHLCFSEADGFCIECARLENIREDERYRVLEQLAAMPADWTRNQIFEAIEPVNGDVLRRKEPRSDLGYS
jgi:hypothetical protein